MKTLKPILFSTPMVQANLDGRKTQTRRQVKVPMGYYEIATNFNKDGELQYIEASNETGADIIIIKPKYQVGDILWVRETWQYNDDLDEPYLYKQKFLEEYKAEFHNTVKWRPSIFMPMEASRTLLKVTNVRAERLQDLSEGDAISEGVELYDTNLYKDYQDARNSFRHARISFATLWESINGKGSWKENPFVWVYNYELYF